MDSTHIILRPQTDDDYEAMAAVATAARPEHPWNAERLRYSDVHRDPRCRCLRYVAELDERIVGLAQAIQYEDLYHPRKYWITVRVHPDYQRQGIGSALYDSLMGHLGEFNPLEVKTSIPANDLIATRFVERRGFEEYSRRWDSIAHLGTFDPAQFAPIVDRVREQNILLRPLRALKNDVNFAEKLHSLFWTLEQDVPFPEPVTYQPLDQFKRNVLGNPNLEEEITLVAVDEDTYAGLTLIFTEADGTLGIDLSGVHPSYRRRGIGTALKAQSMILAKAHGYRALRTTNDPVNAGILAINDRLGFKRLPAQVLLALRLGDEDQT
jgi:mycothiol synthase